MSANAGANAGAGNTPASSPRGALIVFEGLDRTGKTTQCDKLVAHLKSRGLKAEGWRFPDRATTIGTAIDAYLKNKADMDDAAIHLLFAANRFERRPAILAALAAGTTLVVDRYSYSGIVYTAAKGKEGLTAEWCKAPEVGLPAPDLLIYMSLSTTAAAARGGFGEERYETTEMQTKVAKGFDALREDSWLVLDAGDTIDAIHQQVVMAADAAISDVKAGKPLGRLWDRQPLALP